MPLPRITPRPPRAGDRACRARRSSPGGGRRGRDVGEAGVVQRELRPAFDLAEVQRHLRLPLGHGDPLPGEGEPLVRHHLQIGAEAGVPFAVLGAEGDLKAAAFAHVHLRRVDRAGIGAEPLDDELVPSTRPRPDRAKRGSVGELA